MTTTAPSIHRFAPSAGPSPSSMAACAQLSRSSAMVEQGALLSALLGLALTLLLTIHTGVG